MRSPTPFMDDPILDDVIIVIPSKRRPPIGTLVTFGYHLPRPVILLSDPGIRKEHEEWVSSQDHLRGAITVVTGAVGMIPQSMECYRVAHAAGYPWVFRMDDDLTPGFFVDADDNRPSLAEAMVAARKCADACQTTLNGFANTSRTDWLGTGFTRSYGLIHGGCCLFRSTDAPEEFLDPELPIYEDVYRSAAHRARDGAVGRVSWIGLDKRASLRDSAKVKTPEVIERAKRIILGRFPDMVSCNGTRTMDGGRQTIPNWRLIRHKGFPKPSPR